MFAVAGANLFGQWFSDDIILEGFVRVCEPSDRNDFDFEGAKLVQANWSYNIFEAEGTHYISGSWQGKDKQLIALPLPEGFDKNSNTKLIVAGNDKYLVLVDPEKQNIWLIDLKCVLETKKLNLNTQGPVEEHEHVTKRNRKINLVVKVVMTNNAYVYLRCYNKNMQVYTGLMPCYFDTSYCDGCVIDVQCGYEHYILLTDKGKVYTWGNGRRLQLGHGDITNMDTPREVVALGGVNIVKIRAGGWHSAVLSEYGDLYIWGWNDIGQLGVKTRAQRRKEAKEGPSKKKITYTIPTVVDIYDEDLNEVTLNVLDVCCGSKHTAILLDDCSIWAAGSNEYGQLGLPTKDCIKTEHFVKVYQGTKESFLRCGPWSTIVIN